MRNFLFDKAFLPNFVFLPNFKLEIFYFLNYIIIPSTIGTEIVDGIFYAFLIFIELNRKRVWNICVFLWDICEKKIQAAAFEGEKLLESERF